MVLAYFIAALVVAIFNIMAGGKKAGQLVSYCFYLGQLLFAAACIIYYPGTTHLEFFTFDTAGAVFFTIMALVGPAVHYYSAHYMDTETSRRKGIYNALIVLLCAACAGVYFSNNIAVTWIFLELTTLVTAGIIYHRRIQESLEAAWKYVFVCSVGIAIAYMGILLFAGVAGEQGLDYANLGQAIAEGNPLFMKIAFVFILTGYSCKMEIFPLYPVGVDANFSAPAPAGALISTALVNAGFISVFRVFMACRESGIGDWASNVMILTGLFSILISAVFMRRTNNYKRLYSYSTVENMGVAAIGLGIGGVGIFAALLHVAGHSLLKSSAFFQLSRFGKQYGHYNIKKSGGYLATDSKGAMVLFIVTLMLLAFPPSPLFISEVMILQQLAAAGNWWLLVVLVLLLCSVIYNLGRRVVALIYQSKFQKKGSLSVVAGIFPVVVLLLLSVFIGVWRPEWLMDWLQSITKFI